MGRHVPAKKVSLGAALMLVLATAIAAAMVPPPAREIAIVARGMAFYLESDPETPNPRIQVRAGERVRLVLRNEDRGFVHDVAVPVIGEASPLVGWRESGRLTFVVPEAPGLYEYTCQPHALMMRGVLEVVPGS